MTTLGKFFLSQAEFVALPIKNREKLREIFGIPKSGQCRVQTGLGGDKLISDGTEPTDLMNSLNTKALLKFLGREWKEGDVYDFDILFALALSNIFPDAPKLPTETKVIIEKEPVVKPEVPKAIGEKKIIVTQKKRGRPKKQ